VIPLNAEEKNLRTGFGRFTSGVGTGIGDTVGEGTGKGTVVARFAGATTKSTPPSIINANERPIVLLNSIFSPWSRSLSSILPSTPFVVN
jgi:hypothetical protein